MGSNVAAGPEGLQTLRGYIMQDGAARVGAAAGQDWVATASGLGEDAPVGLEGMGLLRDKTVAAAAGLDRVTVARGVRRGQPKPGAPLASGFAST